MYILKFLCRRGLLAFGICSLTHCRIVSRIHSCVLNDCVLSLKLKIRHLTSSERTSYKFCLYSNAYPDQKCVMDRAGRNMSSWLEMSLPCLIIRSRAVALIALCIWWQCQLKYRELNCWEPAWRRRLSTYSLAHWGRMPRSSHTFKEEGGMKDYSFFPPKFDLFREYFMWVS